LLSWRKDRSQQQRIEVADNETPHSILAVNCTALLASISPISREWVPKPHKWSSPKSDPMSVDSAMPPLLPPGLGSIWINESAAAKCSPPKHGRWRTESPSGSGSGPNRSPVLRTTSVRFSAESMASFALSALTAPSSYPSGGTGAGK